MFTFMALAMLAGLFCYAAVAIVLGSNIRSCHIPQFHARGAMLGVALVPTIISLSSYAVFIATSWALPGRLPYYALPVMLAAIILFGGGWTLRLDQGWHGVRGNRIFALLAIFAFLPMLGAIAVQAVEVNQRNHDISVYLNEASALSKAMRDGLAGPFTWLDFRHPDVTHPHSLTFSLYLAWAFLSVESPGFQADLVPRLFVGFNHISVVIAAFAIGMTARSKIAWIVGLLAAGFVLLDPVWDYQLRAASRDTFYLAPVLVVIALLVDAKPRSRDTSVDFARLSILTLALAGALLGHSLGTVYITGAAIGLGLFNLFEHRRSVLAISELWIVGAAVGLAGSFHVFKYLNNGAGSLGFTYPYYNDPALLDSVMQRRDLFKSIGTTDFLATLARQNGVDALILAVVGLAIVATVANARRGTIGTEGRVLLALMCVTVCTVFLILLAPIQLDGITLRSAFASNLRYGFGLGLITFVAAALSLPVLYREASRLVAWPSRPELRLRVLNAFAVATVLAAVAGVGWTGVQRMIHNAPSERGISRAILEKDTCERLRERGARLVYVDNDALLYRCDTQSAYLFTARGAEVVGGRTEAGYGRILDKQRVDAVILTRSIDEFWSRAGFYLFLDRHWKRSYTETHMVIFTRPEFRD